MSINKIKISLNNEWEGLTMSIRIFKGGTFSHSHEAKQLRRIIPEIKQGLNSCLDLYEEDAGIFIDVQLDYSKIDCLVVKDDHIFIIDLKNKGGKIEADLDRQAHRWQIKYPDGREEIYENGKKTVINGEKEKELKERYSPSMQVINYRRNLKGLLKENLNPIIKKYKKKDSEPTLKHLGHMIHCIIIFNEGSEIKLDNYEGKDIEYFLSVLSEDDNLSKKIVDEGSDFEFPENILEIIVEQGHPPDEPEKEIEELSEEEKERWLELDVRSTQKTEESKDELEDIENKLEKDLQSGSLEKIKKAINQLKYLGWEGQYKEYIYELKDSDKSEIREIAFDSLLQIETDPKKISDFVIKFLTDSDKSIRKKAIEEVMNYQLDDAVPILIDRLDKIGDSEEMKLTVDALAVLGDDEAVEPLIELINSFEKQEFSRRYEKRRIISRTIEALGDIGSEEAIDFLLEYLDKDYHHEKVVLALAEIGGTRASETIIERLKQNLRALEEGGEGEKIDEINLYLRAVGKLEDEYGLQEVHGVFELAYGQYHNLVSNALEVIKSKGSNESFDFIFESFKEDPMYEHKIFRTLYNLDKEKYEDEIIRSLVNCINNDSMDMAAKLLQYRIITPTKRKNADKILEMIKNIKIEKPSEHLGLLENISFLLLEYIEDHPEYYEEKKDDVPQLLASEYPERTVIGIHIKAGAEKEDSLTTLEKYLDHEEDIVRRAVIDSILMEKIESKEILPFLFKNINKLEKLDDEIIINFLSHLWHLRRSDIGKNYCMKNDISSPPDFLRDVIIEHDRFVNLEDVAFFWGEESISLLDNLYEEIRELWKEQDPNSANRKSQYIIESCEIIDSEKTIPLLEKIIEDTDQNGIYREDLNSECKELIDDIKS